jgi:hypothetical protein
LPIGNNRIRLAHQLDWGHESYDVCRLVIIEFDSLIN